MFMLMYVVFEQKYAVIRDSRWSSKAWKMKTCFLYGNTWSLEIRLTCLCVRLTSETDEECLSILCLNRVDLFVWKWMRPFLCQLVFCSYSHVGKKDFTKAAYSGDFFFLLNLTGFFTETDLWPVPWINSWNPFGVHPEITPTKPVSVNYDDVILGEMQPCVHATFRAPEPDGLLGILTRKPVSYIYIELYC